MATVALRPCTRGFYQAANPFLALCAKDHTNQPTVSGPECAKCGTSQPASWAGQGPARVAHGSKISSLRVFNTRTSKWVNMGYFTPLNSCSKRSRGGHPLAALGSAGTKSTGNSSRPEGSIHSNNRER